MYRNMATQVVRFNMSVPAIVRKEGKWFYSSCPSLDVHSQGKTEKEALKNLVEALQLFVETCYEQGTFEQMLREQGFVPGQETKGAQAKRMVNVPLPLVTRQNAEALAY